MFSRQQPPHFHIQERLLQHIQHSSAEPQVMQSGDFTSSGKQGAKGRQHMADSSPCVNHGPLVVWFAAVLILLGKWQVARADAPVPDDTHRSRDKGD